MTTPKEYTGFKDKNGKEIFGGDVISVDACAPWWPNTPVILLYDVIKNGKEWVCRNQADDLPDSLLTELHSISKVCRPDNKESDLSRRLGRFTISQLILRKEPEILFDLFHNIIVVDAQANWATDNIDYVGMSYMFNPIPEGTEALEYDISFNRDDKTYKAASKIRFSETH